MKSIANIEGPNEFSHEVSLTIDGVESRFLIDGSYEFGGNYKCDFAEVSNDASTSQEFLRDSTAGNVSDWRELDGYWVEAWSCPHIAGCGDRFMAANFGYQIYNENIAGQAIFYSCYWSYIGGEN